MLLHLLKSTLENFKWSEVYSRQIPRLFRSTAPARAAAVVSAAAAARSMHFAKLLDSHELLGQAQAFSAHHDPK